MLRFMICGLAAVAAGLGGGLAMMPGKASPRAAIVVAGPSLPPLATIPSSDADKAATSPQKAEPAAAPDAAPRTRQADQPPPPPATPTPVASTKAKTTPTASVGGKQRVGLARRTYADDDDDDEC